MPTNLYKSCNELLLHNVMRLQNYLLRKMSQRKNEKQRELVAGYGDSQPSQGTGGASSPDVWLYLLQIFVLLTI